MSSNSAVPEELITLPQGGGALSGIGETFSPDLHTGAGNFSIPFDLPPGRNGLQPELELTYSTGNGNEAFGLGWKLSVPGVSRKTSKGVPIYDDAEDTFILSGAEDLVCTDKSETETRYRPRTEGLFALIIHHNDAENDYWQVRSKDGLVTLYGTPGAAGNDPAVVVDPRDRTKVFAWRLTQTRDPFGNTIKYEYLRDTGEEGSHHWDQLYLSRICYVDYTDGEVDKFLVEVVFEYESRPDPFSRYRAGFEIRTRRRCKGVEIWISADKERLVRSYELAYLDEREDHEHDLPSNGVSLLSKVTVTGHDGDVTESLPPLEFDYTRFEPDKRNFIPLEGRELPSRSLANADLELADLFGNGLPDVLVLNGRARYWRNLGNGRFDLPRPMRDAPGGLALADPGVQLLDADGDGRIDLMVTQNGLSGYYPLQFNGEWDRRSFQRYDRAPGFNLDDPEVRLVDLDGDGVTDAIRSGTRLECFFKDAREGWNDTRFVERQDIEDFPDVNFSDSRVKWGDMSGDGLQDIVLVHDGNVEYWPNLGQGSWGKRVSMRNGPRFPYSYDPERLLVGDVDGDGLDDLVYVDHQRVLLWINQSGNRWSAPVEIQGTPDATNMDDVRLADALGRGIGGVLWSRDAASPGRETMFFLDFSGGLKPYLLDEMSNNMGAVTRVHYAPSTHFYLKDQKRPETRWRTPLPFPVQVVSRVEVIDDISGGKLTSEYSYHHGYWDGAEREFRGFGRVDQRDTETFDNYHAAGLHPDRSLQAVNRQRFSAPTERRTWFHQGPVGEEFGDWEEADYSHEYWTGDPQRLEHTAQVNAFLRSYNSGPAGGASPCDRRIKRAALRTLRGRMLRSELYALDESSQRERPYTVTEYAYKLREEARPTGSNAQRERIFFPQRSAERTTQWERGDDPMTKFTFSDDYDDFGQPRQETIVAMPRRRKKRKNITAAVIGELEGDQVNETRVLATHTRTVYATPEPDLYVHDRAAQVRTFELKEPPEVDESDAGDVSQVLGEQAAAARRIHEQFCSGPESDVRLMGHTRNHYDGEAFVGRGAGEVGPYGALTRSEALVFGERELDAAYGERRPTYLGGAAAPPDGAPQDFGQDHGYRLQQGAGDRHAGYYADTKRQRFDFQADGATEKRGIVTAVQDHVGHQTTIEPDRYGLLPARVIDPVGLQTDVINDYRVMQPNRVTDANGNSAHFRYTPLGMLNKQFLESRDGAGGTEEKPEVEFTYDFLAYEKTRDDERPQPIFVHTSRRLRHASEGVTDETIESREYSDGFGRLVQTRAQAEELIFGKTGDDVGLSAQPGAVDGPAVGRRVPDQVIVSGWQVYNNKGEVIEKYEPFFASGWAYQPQAEAKRGRHASVYYDPRGKRIRTVNPDGSEQRVIFGVPDQSDTPDAFAPTPWEIYTYDPNDLAPVSQSPDEPEGSLAERAPQAHHSTPASTVFDALGRAICQVERNGPTPEIDWHVTRSAYDMRGNLLTVIDALGRVAFSYAYDLRDDELSVESVDGGLCTSVHDAAGNLIEYRDGKGSVALRRYDERKRLTHLWARDDDSTPVTLRQRLIYGDDERASGLSRETARQAHLLGQLYKHYDEAGLLRIERYDFQQNPEQQKRQVISDEALEEGWAVDWSKEEAEDDLDSFEYQTDTRYDALNRPLEITYPADVNGKRAVLVPHYNRAGALENVALDGDPHVTYIAYNARGQRVLIAYGNAVMTRYAYNPDTFRLERLRSESYQETASGTFEGEGRPLQEFSYRHDLLGNITAVEDRTPGSGIANSQHGKDRLVRDFSYDPLYRLTQATGRACKDDGAPRPPGAPIRCGRYDVPFGGAAPAPNQRNAPQLTAAYAERYDYDPAGNLLELHRTVGHSARKRSFTVDVDSNRLQSVAEGGTTQRFRYDANGNVTRENTERHYTWDHADRLIHFTNQPEGSDHASVEARYLYDANGMRVKKYVRKNGNGNGESAVSVDGIFEHHTWKKNGERKENNYLHVVDDRQRIALVRRGPAHPRDAGPPLQLHLGDHLGSSHVVVDGDGDWINREEYFPYGETSFGSFARKRFRFSGKERDDESGFYYHGARYYATLLARWMSPDAAGMADTLNLYEYVRGNPLKFTDPDGQQTDAPQQDDELIASSSDKHGRYWYFASGASIRRLEEPEVLGGVEIRTHTSYMYYPPGADKPSHVRHEGEWVRWMEGETIEISGRGSSGWRTLGAGALALGIGVAAIATVASGGTASPLLAGLLMIGGTGSAATGSAQMIIGGLQLTSQEPEQWQREVEGLSTVSDITNPGGQVGFWAGAISGSDPEESATIGAGVFSMFTGLLGSKSAGAALERRQEFSELMARLEVMTGTAKLLDVFLGKPKVEQQ